MENYYIKTNRTFTFIRKNAWIITLLVALGGLYEPKLGLLVVFIMGGLLTTAFFRGRYWCGNFCPHSSLFDRIFLPISLNKKIPKILKSKPVILAVLAFFFYNFSRKIMGISGLWGTYDFLDKLGAIFSRTYLMVLIVGGILAIAINPRTWCQFCPMGIMQKLSYRLGKFLGISKKFEKKVTIEAKEKCHSCGKCSRVCPFQLTPYLEFSEKNQFDNINCIKCATCIENCPANILSLRTEEEALELTKNVSLEGYENRQRISAKIVDIKDLTEDVKEFTFSFISPGRVDYKPGQFILVKIQDDPKSYRAYSISSSNEDNRQVKIIVKRVERGYGTSIIFNSFNIGDEVELEGPMGNNLVVDPTEEKLLFVANGIGITPFIGLSKWVLSKNPSIKSLILLNGQRYEKDLLYNDYFKSLDKEYENFQYVPILSREKLPDIKKGYVTDILKYMDLEGYKVYMCGTRKMIEDSYKILLDKGIKEEDIFYESESRIDLKNKDTLIKAS